MWSVIVWTVLWTKQKRQQCLQNMHDELERVLLNFVHHEVILNLSMQNLADQYHLSKFLIPLSMVLCSDEEGDRAK
jgi:hypothetical protein